jgi:uncharacterized tellurite resistance protein B-like protein
MLFFSTQPAPLQDGPGSALALLVLIAAIVGWLGVRAFIRRLRARKAESVVRGAFPDYALEALANAARLDGRIADVERAAIAQAMRDIAGASFDSTRLDEALSRAALTKDELVAYLEDKSRLFSNEQKVQFLKALLGVFVADGRFDEIEHHALIEYTAAVGFDRQSAPQMLRGLVSDMAKDRIT